MQANRPIIERVDSRGNDLPVSGETWRQSLGSPRSGRLWRAPAPRTDFPSVPPLLLCLLQQERGSKGGQRRRPEPGRPRPPGCVGSKVPAGFVLTLGVWQSAPRGQQGGRDGVQTMRAGWPGTRGPPDLGAADSRHRSWPRVGCGVPRSRRGRVWPQGP